MISSALFKATAIDQACHYLQEAVDSITQTRATNSLQHVHQLRQQLQPWSALQEVKDVDERLRPFRRGLL